MEKERFLDTILRQSRRILTEDKVKDLSVILFWGSIWGILEATVGLVLHALPFKVPTGAIMFPIGYYFMQKSYRNTNHNMAMFYTSAIAASIKLINLLSPIVHPIKVLNPAACILLEGLSVALVFKYFVQDGKALKFINAVSMSLIWRVGYYIMCFGIFIPLSMMNSRSILEKSYIMDFFIKNGLINSILIYLYSKLQYKCKNKPIIKYHPVFSSSVLILAIIITWMV